MKRVFSLLLAAMLLFLPVTAFATEETPDVPSPSIKDETVSVIAPVPSSPNASIPEIDISDDSITPEQPNTENNSNETSNNPTNVTETSTDEVSSKESVSEAAETEDSDSSEKTSEVTEESEDTSEETEESEEHIHEFTYRSNGDGTHTVTCTAKVRVPSNDTEESEPVYEKVDCTYEEIESCTFDDDGKCIYCEYEEEKAFNPTISVEIEEQTCVIGKTNPLICLYISDANYDIAYAQICFANYTKNKYINVGLSRGKYYNDLIDKFVNTADDGWYASPNITADYSTGEYEIRSIYIRTSTDESIHYSLESNSLPEQFSNSSITVESSIGSTITSLKNSITGSSVDSTSIVDSELIEAPSVDLPQAAPVPDSQINEEPPADVVDEGNEQTSSVSVSVNNNDIPPEKEALLSDVTSELSTDVKAEKSTESTTDEKPEEDISATTPEKAITEAASEAISETPTNSVNVASIDENKEPAPATNSSSDEKKSEAISEPAPEEKVSGKKAPNNIASTPKDSSNNTDKKTNNTESNKNNTSKGNIFSQIVNFFRRLFKF